VIDDPVVSPTKPATAEQRDRFASVLTIRTYLGGRPTQLYDNAPSSFEDTLIGCFFF
jgi:hypothetical protein